MTCEFCRFLARDDQKDANYTLALMRKPKGIHVQQYSYWVYDMGPSEHGYPINYCPVCGKEMKHDEQGSV